MAVTEAARQLWKGLGLSLMMDGAAIMTGDAMCAALVVAEPRAARRRMAAAAAGMPAGADGERRGVLKTNRTE